ncbi:MAG: hypothetical protein PHD48_05540 [Alphaproteobacteria bacterium]|nr:hypothetical protein [Alphaproteobacteria bacterium]
MSKKVPASVDQWKNQTVQCLAVAEELATALAGMDIPSAADPKALVLALLARSMSNTHGAIVMVDQTLIVEARSLVRLVYENMFYVAALHQKGVEFVKQLKAEEMATRRLRAQNLLELAKPDGKQDWEENLRSLLREQKGGTTTKGLTPKVIAGMGPTCKGYLIYSQLCADAGHPTAESLSRYLREIKVDGKHQRLLELNYKAPATEEEMSQTLDWVCSALIGVIIGVNEMFGGSSANDSINQMVASYQTMNGYQTFPEKPKT